MEKAVTYTIRECLWCGKKYKTKLINGYQPSSVCCCKSHRELYREYRDAKYDDYSSSAGYGGWGHDE